MADIRKKKILMTLMRLEIGGAETHVLELSLELARMGFDIVVASGGGVYEEHLKAAGIPHYTVPMYTKHPARMAESLRMLKKIIRDEQIDIVHAHGRIPAFLCGILHKMMDFTFVTTAHWVFRTSFWFKQMTNWGEKVMAVSEDIKTYLMDNYGTNPKDISVTINGIDTNKFSPEADYSKALAEFSLPEESKKIVYISRMDEDRALVAFHLAEIAPEIENAFPGTDIVIVGGGNVFDKLKALTDEINGKIGRKMITLTGGRTDIDQFAAMSDLFIGVSRSALEAMACAKPVIVAGNEGYLGIFEEDKLQVGIDTNFCCRGLAESTKELLLEDVKKVLSASKEQQEAWGAYSRKVICENYSVSKMAEDNARMYCAAIDKKPWDVVISGYYGYGNSGDEALLSAMLCHLREEMPEANICVLSKNPKETAAVYGVESVNRYRYFKIKKMFKKTKLFISGGGSLLQDVTSSRSIKYYLSLIKLAKSAGAAVMLYANGIGPVNKEANRLAVQKALNAVDVITLREETSKEELKQLGIPAEKVTVTADPALSIQPASKERIDEVLLEEGISPEEKLLGISVRQWKESDKDFIAKLAEVIDTVCKERQLVPVFVPMQYPLDFDFSQSIANLLSDKCYIIGRSRPAEELIGLVSRMDAMLAERLHSLIYAVNAFVPTVGLSYDTKVDAFMEYIGIGTGISVEEFSVDKAINAVYAVLDNRDDIQQALKEKHVLLCDKAKENAHIAGELIRRLQFGL
ncbi:MAG: polysaccharide pyruvyl transferase CsaB [Clostridia bacterium]|nr:polysaccharide pyruvyl transferase CsaB [Clostridia bacterium]